MTVRSVLLSLVLCVCVTALAPVEPAHAEREMSRKVRSVHAPIPTGGASLQGTRLAILYGMLGNKRVKWLYEGESKNSILARWDYRGGSVLANIVYDQNQIQVQYVDGSADYTCQDLEAGVCHKNSGAYFNYMPHLRKSIARQIRWYRTKPVAEDPEDGDGEDETQGEEKQ